MKTLAEVVADLNAVKTEHSSSTRIVVPGQDQAEENYRLVASLLEGTAIDQAELAGISLHVAASAVNSIATVDGGIDGGELMALIGSLWVDGVVVGVRYMAELYGSANGTRDSQPAEPTETGNGPDRAENADAGPAPDRRAAQDDPRGERDR